jgi:hypothetical protein
MKNTISAVMVASLLVAGQAWGDDDGRGGGRGGDGRGGWSGGGGGERSSRSFSGGGGGGRSFSRGGGERSFSGGGGERSFRSFSGGEGSRSFSRGQGQEFSRSFSRGNDSPRSYSRNQMSNRSVEGDRSRRTIDSSQWRNFSRGQDSGDRPSFSRSREAFRGDQSGERSLEGRTSRDYSVGRNFQERQQQLDQSNRQFQARRPTDEQVREFLQMRRDGEVSRSGERGGRSFQPEGDNRIVRRPDEVTRRGDDENRDLRNGREIDQRTVGGRDFRGRDLRGADDPRDRLARERDGDLNRDRDIARNRDLDRGDRNYQRWRDSAWRGERGEGRDHRDWSGKWKEGDRFVNANRIRDHWRREWWRDRDRDDDWDDVPFHAKWWDRHDRHHRHWHFWGDFAHHHHRPFYWWTWTTAPRLSAWVTFGWPTYYYWDYGPGEYIYYDDGVIYVNGRWYAPGPVFYDRTVRLIERAPDIGPEQAAQVEWLPLGVFAVTPDGVAEPEIMVQLAVTKDGIIGGTAFNQATGVSYAIQGVVEKETQRAVWSYADAVGKRINMETSVFNLTQPEATGLVHYSPNDIRVIQLVRLEDPSAGGAAPAPAAAAEGELPPPAVPR